MVPYFLALLPVAEPAWRRLISTVGTAASAQPRERISSAVWAAWMPVISMTAGPAPWPGRVITNPWHEPLPPGRELLTLSVHQPGPVPAAGDRNVIVICGANLLGQYLNAGAIDELTVSVAPVLLGAGKRLFGGSLRADLALEQAGVIESPFVTHLRYRLTSPGETS